MVEVVPKSSELKLPFWRYLAFLLFMIFLGILFLWGILASQWGASNSIVELFRKYLGIVNRFRPNAKPEDNLANNIRIHRVERLPTNRYAFFFSVTDSSGDPISPIAKSSVTISVGDPGSTPKPVVIDKITPLKDLNHWTNRMTFAAVMDYSGSMFPEDLDAIENNYSYFINAIKFPFSATVIKFHSGVEETLPLSNNISEIEAALKKRIPLGNTALYAGMMKGIENIRIKDHFRFLLLTTDGNNNVSGPTLDEVIQASRQYFISSFVMGFGWLNVNVLKRIAEETDGYYVYVPDSSDLKNKFPKIAEIINNVQVAEFVSSIDLQPNSVLEIAVTTPSGILRRTRN